MWGLLTTGAAITGLNVLAPAAGRLPELAVLTVTNVAATMTRFLLLRAEDLPPATAQGGAGSHRPRMSLRSGD
jgi:hypothetical protein